MSLITVFDQGSAVSIAVGATQDIVNRSGSGVVDQLMIDLSAVAKSGCTNAQIIFTIDGGTPIVYNVGDYFYQNQCGGFLTAVDKSVLMPSRFIYDKAHDTNFIYISIPKITFSSSIKIQIKNNGDVVNPITLNSYIIETIIE